MNDSLVVSNYELDATFTGIESWADTITILAGLISADSPRHSSSSRDLTRYACFGLLRLSGINNSSIPSRSMDFR